jgi:hypothetical protein
MNFENTARMANELVVTNFEKSKTANETLVTNFESSIMANEPVVIIFESSRMSNLSSRNKLRKFSQNGQRTGKCTSSTPSRQHTNTQAPAAHITPTHQHTIIPAHQHHAPHTNTPTQSRLHQHIPRTHQHATFSQHLTRCQELSGKFNSSLWYSTLCFFLIFFRFPQWGSALLFYFGLKGNDYVLHKIL